MASEFCSRGHGPYPERTRNHTCKQCERERNRSPHRRSYAAEFRSRPEQKIKTRECNRRYNSTPRRRLGLRKNVDIRRARINGCDRREISYRDIRNLDRGSCYICGHPGSVREHLIPLSRGGRHAIGNLLSSCQSCNSSKNQKTIMEYRKYRGFAKLYCMKGGS